MGVHEPHFCSVSFGDTGDQILNVAEGSTDCGAGLARAEPGFYLQLPLPRLILDELEIQVQMLEMLKKLASRSSASINLAFNIICTSSGMSMVSEDNTVFIFG